MRPPCGSGTETLLFVVFADAGYVPVPIVQDREDSHPDQLGLWGAGALLPQATQGHQRLSGTHPSR